MTAKRFIPERHTERRRERYREGHYQAILPPFLRIVGFPADGDVLTIVRICAAGIAVLYVLKGPPFPA